MASFSKYLANALVNHLFGAPYSAPSSVFVALCTADPTTDGTGLTLSEPSGGAYSRMEALFNAAADRATANNTAIAFPTATASWGTISHFALLDAETDGNVLAYKSLDVPRRIIADGGFNIPNGDLDVSMNFACVSDYLANELLDHVFIDSAFSAPASIFACLCTAVPVHNDNGSTIAEPATGNYARVEHNDWETAADGLSSNASKITFPKATATVGTITHFAIADEPTAGNLLLNGPIGGETQILEDDEPIFDVNTLIVRFIPA